MTKPTPSLAAQIALWRRKLAYRDRKRTAYRALAAGNPKRTPGIHKWGTLYAEAVAHLNALKHAEAIAHPARFSPMFAVDYSDHTVSSLALKAAGVRVVCRYLCAVGNPKDMTPDESARHHAAGIGRVLVFERGAIPEDSFAAGVRDASAAAHEAVTLGWPHENGHMRPIYFAVDGDVTGESVRDYFRGLVSVLGVDRVGVYGGLRVCTYLLDVGLVRWVWQTYAWSDGPVKVDPQTRRRTQWCRITHIRQVRNDERLPGVGVSVDFDTIMAADCGQF